MYIAEWHWTDESIEHIARHGVRPSDVLAAWRGSPKFRRNKKNRAATHQMIGPDSSGHFLAVFIREDDVYEGRWRVITARSANDAERAWWKRN
ncbi:MAG TPA: hypothetical protein VG317_10785 [Pseudonocardiaceae bacterium]|nr:hypothetical protein [Pseudonocardiaceae bacterium]